MICYYGIMRKMGRIQSRTVIAWTSNASWFKINTDACIDALNGRTKIGVIIRDCRDFIIASCVQGLDFFYFPLQLLKLLRFFVVLIWLLKLAL
ncbi:hypothetical protein ACOSP7_004238 [Xanthoceras sorbifolium]